LAVLMDRVHAIALAQDQLSFQGGVSNVEFGDYLRALCSNINAPQEGVSIEIEATRDVLLPLDRAVPAGLIVNELMTNAFKYAFDASGGVIRITFTANRDTHEAVLTIEDNGRGMSEPREGGMGLRLIEALTAQIEGHLERPDVKKGTSTSVKFPLPL
jgi:two-component sensor histidine kinase